MRYKKNKKSVPEKPNLTMQKGNMAVINGDQIWWRDKYEEKNNEKMSDFDFVKQ